MGLLRRGQSDPARVRAPRSGQVERGEHSAEERWTGASPPELWSVEPGLHPAGGRSAVCPVCWPGIAISRLSVARPLIDHGLQVFAHDDRRMLLESVVPE